MEQKKSFCNNFAEIRECLGLYNLRFLIFPLIIVK